jgi:hypothetical protein
MTRAVARRLGAFLADVITRIANSDHAAHSAARSAATS